MKKQTTPTVDAIGRIYIEGNITPREWFQNLRLPSGKPDTIAVILLSETFYWYRPTIERDEETGEVKEIRRKFDADKWQASYRNLAERFGFTRKQVRDAMARLKEKGLVTLELRNIRTKSGMPLSNCLFIEPVPENIEKLSKIETESDDVD